jgi:hypothetical protein
MSHERVGEEVASDLGKGTAETILAPENQESFTLSPEAEAALFEAIEEADRGDFVSADELLRELRRDRDQGLRSLDSTV